MDAFLMGQKQAGVDFTLAPRITFDGKWTDWYVQDYGGVPYWEAVIFSSGALTVTGSLKADAWGIGGGSGGGSGGYGGGSGYTGMALGISLTGTLAVGIGAGGNDYDVSGGATVFGALLTCGGGGRGTGSSQAYGGSGGSYDYTLGGTNGSGGASGIPGDGKPMSRFGDAEKAADAGSARIHGGSGWLHWCVDMWDGEGYGAGGGGQMKAKGHSGALVLRVPMG